MADSTAYSGSGGWSGGAPLAAGGVLSNYYQKLKSVDPSSGSLTTSQPGQASSQPSSLARVATTTPAQPAQASSQPAVAAAAPTIAAIPVSLPSVAAVPTVSRTLANSGAQAPTQTIANSGVVTQPAVTPSAGVSASVDPNSFAKAAGANAQAAQVAYGGPQVVASTVRTPGQFGADTYYARFNPATGQYEALGYMTAAGQYVSANGHVVSGPAALQVLGNALGHTQPTFIAESNNGQYTPNMEVTSLANKQYGTQLSAYQTAYSAAQAAATQQNQNTMDAYAQAQAAALAQEQADRATAFNLATGLQAPNTTAVDQAGANDLARVVSQYRSGLGGADAAAYNYAGQAAQATQTAVNQVAHDTAYANAFNSNYSTFANALTAQQTADANASGQKLSYDMQGISQALDALSQQAGQLRSTKQTQFNAQLIPIKNQLAQYQLAVQQYGVSSSAAMSIAKGLLSAAGSLAAGAV